MDRDPQPGKADSFDLIIFLWKRRKQILWITLLGAVAGIIAAFVIRPQFKSEIILFPAITNSVSKAMLTEQSTGRDDILALGDEEDAEQLLQIIQTDEIRERISERHDLMSVYRIKPDAKHKRTLLKEEYEDHVLAEYTKFGSVSVQVLDEDPQRAADMANDIAAQVDTVWRGMQHDRAVRGLSIVRSAVDHLEKEIKQMEDSMQTLRLLGVQDYESQTERYSEQLGHAILTNNQRAIAEFEKRFKVLALYGGAYVTLQDRLFNEEKRLSMLRTKLEQAQADMHSDMPHKFVVNKAQPADKKSYPIRWLIVVMSTISAFLLSLLLIVVQENVRKIKLHAE